MLEIAKIIDRKLQYPCIHNFTSYKRHVSCDHHMTFVRAHNTAVLQSTAGVGVDSHISD